MAGRERERIFMSYVVINPRDLAIELSAAIDDYSAERIPIRGKAVRNTPTSTATGGNMRQFNASVLTDFIGDGNKPEDDNLRGEEMSGKQRAGIING